MTFWLYAECVSVLLTMVIVGVLLLGAGTGHLRLVVTDREASDGTAVTVYRLKWFWKEEEEAEDDDDIDTDFGVCRICGCSDEAACPGGCYWVEDPEGKGELCSACLEECFPEEAAKRRAGHLGVPFPLARSVNEEER